MQAPQRLLIWVASVVMVACSQKEPAPVPTPAAPPEKPEAFRENPDFGGVKSVSASATAVAPSLEEATLRALDQAIAQVNGRRVKSAQAAASDTLQIDVNGLRALDAGSRQFADLVVSSSQGAVKSFEVLSSEQVEKVAYESEVKVGAESGNWLSKDAFNFSASETLYDRYWKVTVKAEVAKFVAPKDDGRPTLVVAAPQTSSSRYEVGDDTIDAAVVAKAIRGRLSDAITQTERFKTVDREFNAELQAEVDFIKGDNARAEDIARLGQRLAADLILIPVIDRFEYPREVKNLRYSDKQLISYAGGATITLRLLNASTGEVVLSETFRREIPPTPPSTMPRLIDGEVLADEVMDSLADGMITAVINEIFPISVIALKGNTAVLSQGGKAVSVGQRYNAVILEDELTDPQTGRSLGRLETPCCVISIVRVSDQTSYGKIDGELPPELAMFKPGMVELRERLEEAAAPTAPTVISRAPVPSTSGESTPRSRAPAPAKESPDRESKPAEDENW